MPNENPIPVFMYHTVGIPDNNWSWRHLTCPYEKFEKQLKCLHKRGFETISLKELYNYIFEGMKVPPKSLILTFDDGYADNWIFAYPIMKKYGMKGTIFVNPEFADKRDILRKRIDQVNYPEELDRTDISGFLSWREMKECERGGVFDIESHAMSHTWHPSSDKIIDFRHPGDNYIWMTWNKNMSRKPYLQFDDPELVNYGEPVYQFSKSLESPRYFPNEDLSKALVDYVKENGGQTFFQNNEWRKILFKKAETLKEIFAPGSYETEIEYRERVRRELLNSRNIIQEKLEKEIEFLCWPGGSSTQTGLQIAREVGYKMTTVGRDLDISIRRELFNIPSEKSDRIARISPFLYWDGKASKNSKAVYDSGFTILLKLIQYKSGGITSLGVRILRKLMKEGCRILPISRAKVS